MRALPSICFVTPQALPALVAPHGGGSCEAAPSRQAGVGGAELQQALLGRELARRGQRVTFVVNGTDGGRGSVPAEIDGMKVIVLPAPSKRPPPDRAERRLEKGRRLVVETRYLFQAMLEADSDIYTVRSNHFCAAVVASWCRLWKRPFVFASGHDGNCDLALAHRRPHRLVAVSYAAALRLAGAVVVQGEAQQASMMRHLGVKAVIIPNAIDPGPLVPQRRRRGVLWVGTIEPRKGADRLLEIASICPGVSFQAAGGPGDHPRYHAESLRRGRELPNLSWLGPLPHEEVLALLAEAALFLNTSRTEGFPNTFLEAWKMGAPVVSQEIDPDGCLRRHGIGVVTGDIPRTQQAILDLLRDPRLRDAMARAGRQYLESRHALPAVVDRWEDLCRRVAARNESVTVPLGGAA